MTKRNLTILFCLLIISVQGRSQINNKGISIKEFTDNPWPFDPNVQAVHENYDDYLKVEQYAVKNRFEPAHKDTITRFFKGKTEIFFYKPYNGKPLLVTANIFDKKIKLKGDISIGLTAKEFYSRVNYPKTSTDTVLISLPGGIYNTTVIFNDDKISRIKIEAKKRQ